MRSIVALAYTLLMAVLAAAVPFHGPARYGKPNDQFEETQSQR